MTTLRAKRQSASSFDQVRHRIVHQAYYYVVDAELQRLCKRKSNPEVQAGRAIQPKMMRQEDAKPTTRGQQQKVAPAQEAVKTQVVRKAAWRPPVSVTLRKLRFPSSSELVDVAFKRKEVLPDSFANAKRYFLLMANAALELVQIRICEAAKVFYDHLNSKAFWKRGDLIFHPQVDIGFQEFMDPVCGKKQKLTINFAEVATASSYGQNDIWLLFSADSSCKDGLLVRSSWHSPGHQKQLEVVPIDPSDLSLFRSWASSQEESALSLHAVKLFNAHTDWLVIERLLHLHEWSATAATANLLAERFPLCTWLLDGTKLPLQRDYTQLMSQEQRAKWRTEFPTLLQEFQLNEDQSSVIHDFMCKLEMEDAVPVTLCHGSFGSGKSFLVSVLIMFLYRIMGDSTKIMISSNTNIAVDRILLSLLQLKFTNFVRVGTLRKIDKRILPFMLQLQNTNDDIKELQRVLREDTLSVDEQEYVAVSILCYYSEL